MAEVKKMNEESGTRTISYACELTVLHLLQGWLHGAACIAVCLHDLDDGKQRTVWLDVLHDDEHEVVCAAVSAMLCLPLRWMLSSRESSTFLEYPLRQSRYAFVCPFAIGVQCAVVSSAS